MYEIIHIVDLESPSGLGRRNLQIEAVEDHPLAAGYYFVLWPVARPMTRNTCKRYFGPFPTRSEARLMHRSALALGLIQDGNGVQSIAECRSIVRPPPAPSVRVPVAPSSLMPMRREPAACAA